MFHEHRLLEHTPALSLVLMSHGFAVVAVLAVDQAYCTYW